MRNIQITLVPPGHVMDAWDAAYPFMERAAKATNGRYEAEDILETILHLHHHLWLVFDDQRVLGALVTALRQYPRKRYLELAFIGGDEGALWKDQMLDIMQRWAYDNSCDGIDASARLGWAKIFKGDGYQPMWQVFELPLRGEALGD